MGCNATLVVNVAAGTGFLMERIAAKADFFWRGMDKMETVSIWPALVMIILMTLGMATNLFNHGKARPTYNFYAAFLIGLPIQVLLLYYGNFFAPLGWSVLQ
jgi:hypothetical protein